MNGAPDVLGVGQRLLLGDVGLDRLALGLDDGQRPAVLVEQHVIGAANACDGMLGDDLSLVRRVPAGLPQHVVYQDPGVGFFRFWQSTDFQTVPTQGYHGKRYAT